MSLGAHKDLREGEELLQIGNTESEAYSTSVLKVSKLFQNLSIGLRRHTHLIHLSSGSITSGASGSPLFNRKGKVVALFNSGRSTQKYAVRIDYVVDALKSIENGAIPSRGDLGVGLATVEVKDVLRYFEDPKGVLKNVIERAKKRNSSLQHLIRLDQAAPGTPAGEILKPTDLMIAIEGRGEKVELGEEIYDFDRVVNENVGGKVMITVFRDGKLQDFEIPVRSAAKATPFRFARFGGAVFHDVTTNLGLHFSIPSEGVYMSSAAPDISLFKSVGNIYQARGTDQRYGKRRVILQEVLGKKMKSLDDFVAAVKDLKTADMIHILYQDQWSIGSSVYLDPLYVDADFDPLRVFQWDADRLEWVEEKI